MVEQVSFSNNTSANYGGALMIYGAPVFFDSTDKSQNNTEFIGNSAGHGGGAIRCESCTLFFKSSIRYLLKTQQVLVVQYL